MITSGQTTSSLVPLQLPEFVRDNPDYANFSLFLKAYYEWMEQQGKVTERTKNLLNYKDIDQTTDEFLDYFTNDFLPYFPKDVLIDKQKAIKVARELYETKGTPASYEFLFRILFNSDFDIYYTKDVVLKASSGQWYVAKSLKLNSLDPNLLNIKDYRLFGETTKSIATVENSVVAAGKTEVFISNIERLFQSGEFVRVIDSNNQDVLFNGEPLRAKIVGQISQVNIDPQNRGLLYKVGDPVVIYGGLASNTGIGATAQVVETTTGSIKSINVITGGYGYRFTPNTTITIPNAPGAQAYVGSLDPAGIANVSFIPTESIGLKKDVLIGNSNYHFANIATSNANTTLANAFSFVSFSTYPVSSVYITNGGGGIVDTPQVNIESDYFTDTFSTTNLASLGILAPIKIVNGGLGYRANDKIVFSGGTGIGARANVTNVAANGAITSVSYVLNTRPDFPLGGMGYTNTTLPTLSVQSSNTQANGAVLSVPAILGTGATFSSVVDRAGSITTIAVTYPGEDYISTPNVSLKVQDIVVTGVSIYNLPLEGDFIYQGTDANNSSYSAYVDSITGLTVGATANDSTFLLRTYNYNSDPDITKTLKIDKGINLNINSFKNYGDTTAKAKVTFLNGLVVSQGKYLTSQGQPSSFDVLQSSEYNNYTYEISVEKEIAKYRDVLLNLLHPTGMNLIGRYLMKSSNKFNFVGVEATYQGHTLYYNTLTAASNATISTSFTNKSNNIIQFTNLSGADLSGFITPNVTSIAITPIHGPSIHSDVLSVNTVTNQVTISSNVWLTYSNVAIITANVGSNVINISTLTGAYDIINNGRYSNTAYPLMDIVYAGDNVLVDNNTSKLVSSVDYVNGLIYLSSNLTSNANSYLSVNRTFIATSNNVILYGPLGVQYVPEVATQDGRLITTEDGRILILG